MCLMFYQPPGITPPDDDAIREAWKGNSHGAGFMFCKDGELVIEKPFFKLAEFMKAYKAAHEAYGKLSPFVVHFRYATHGLKNGGNTHPHPLADGKVGLAHNGILYDFEPPRSLNISDTVWFCETVLAGRHELQLMTENFREWLEGLIGGYNKFILLCADGSVSIVNEDEGVWDNGIWYSNEGYKPRPAKAQCCGSSLFDKPADEQKLVAGEYPGHWNLRDIDDYHSLVWDGMSPTDAADEIDYIIWREKQLV